MRFLLLVTALLVLISCNQERITPANFFEIENIKLRQVDFDGQFEYTDVVIVNRGRVAANDVKVFPNPANDWIQVLSPNGALIQIEIWSLDGQLERQWRNVDTSEKLLFQGLKPGVHLLKMYTPKGVLVKKMVVEQ